ncbi:type II toxin-antitoxin system RelB/DinJ family antitoxin [Pseudothauera lacus]
MAETQRTAASRYDDAMILGMPSNRQMTFRRVRGTMQLNDTLRLRMWTSNVGRTRIDRHIKVVATDVLAGMGLFVSDAIRMFLTRISADRTPPLDSILLSLSRIPTDNEAHSVIFQ